MAYIPSFTNHPHHPLSSSDKLSICATRAFRLKTSHNSSHTHDLDQLVREIETTVTQKSNPSAHRMAFSSITQKDGESIKDFTIHLKSTALDCEFACPSCSLDQLFMNVKDQVIRGLASDVLQTDILAMANQLKSFEYTVRYAEA